MQQRRHRPCQRGRIRPEMRSSKPVDRDGGDGPLSTSEFSRSGDGSDPELSVKQVISERDASRFRKLFEDAPCGYIVLNLDGEIVQANAAFRELARLDNGKAIGASFRNLLGPAGAIFFDTQ